MFHLISDSNDVQSLLELGANPNIQNFDGQTVLNYYLAQHKIEAAQKLLELAPDSLDVSTRDYFSSTPLLNAIKTGDYDIVKSIIGRASANSALDVSSYMLQANTIGQTPGLMAIMGAPDLLPLLIPHSKEPLLVFAVKNNSIQSIKILVENGYPIDLPDEQGWPALMRAVADSNEPAVTELLKYKPNLTMIFSDPEVEEVTLAYTAAKSKNINIISKLLKAGFPIDFGSEHGATMLWNAAFFANLGLVKFLLENGANPNAGMILKHNGKNDTPLCYMMNPDHEDISLDADIIIELLKNSRTNVDKCAGTPVLTEFLYHYLKELPLKTTLQIIQLFIERGSPITEKCLELTKDYPEIHKLLEEAQAHQQMRGEK